jgi:hypothetical protein
MDRMPLVGPARDLYINTMAGFRDHMERSDILPWDLSRFFIEDLERALKEPEGLKGDEIINVLVMAAQVDFSELKKDWDKLSIKERGAVVSRIIEGMAAFGLMSLFGSIATNTSLHDKEEILRVALKYYKGKISYNDMVSEIEDIIWPSRRDKAVYWNYIESYKKGTALAEYLPKEIVRAIVGVYLIKIIWLQQFDGMWAVPNIYPRFFE